MLRRWILPSALVVSQSCPHIDLFESRNSRIDPSRVLRVSRWNLVPKSRGFRRDELESKKIRVERRFLPSFQPPKSNGSHLFSIDTDYHHVPSGNEEDSIVILLDRKEFFIVQGE